MSWSFKVGDKVVCVDGSPGAIASGDGLVEGQIYTISAVTARFSELAVQLAEFHYSPREFCRASRFRPLVDQGMKTLQGLLAPSPAKSREVVE